MAKKEKQGHTYYALVEYWWSQPFVVDEDHSYNGPEYYWIPVDHREYLDLKRDGYEVDRDIDVNPETGKERWKPAKSASKK